MNVVSLFCSSKKASQRLWFRWHLTEGNLAHTQTHVGGLDFGDVRIKL